ncbi:hypothetical protein [Flocculibacter collagenilyticus]|uniref:hypothetical protein n=1 Tax=Flocculibacter collagenilyticus TaxID=2744479 RepID=UPI0018F7A883|nr:hypothetical protein [Flocculibacter collagenilyticus]
MKNNNWILAATLSLLAIISTHTATAGLLTFNFDSFTRHENGSQDSNFNGDITYSPTLTLNENNLQPVFHSQSNGDWWSVYNLDMTSINSPFQQTLESSLITPFFSYTTPWYFRMRVKGEYDQTQSTITEGALSEVAFEFGYNIDEDLLTSTGVESHASFYLEHLSINIDNTSAQHSAFNFDQNGTISFSDISHLLNANSGKDALFRNEAYHQANFESLLDGSSTALDQRFVSYQSVGTFNFNPPQTIPEPPTWLLVTSVLLFFTSRKRY